MRYLLFWLSVLVSCTVMWAEAVAQPARQDRLDEASLTAAASNLWQTISQAVSQVGGDLEHQHLHLVLAFSTGHFNKDPMAAQAAKQVAWHVVREYLIAGDRVSCYAWEMDLWEHLPPGQQYTVTLTDSSDEGKKFIQDLFPQTVQDGSRGGHDTERAIVQIVRRLGDARDAVIVLLTNDAQSVAPRGMQTIGTDNPTYQQVLQNWTRLPQVSKSGASLVLPYKVHKSLGGVQDRSLGVVIVLPKRPELAAIAGGTRSRFPPEKPKNEVRASTRPPTTWLWLLLFPVLLVLVAGAVAAKRFLQRAGSATAKGVRLLTIGDEKVDITGVDDGQVVCLIAGDNYKSSAGEGAPVVRSARETDVVLAELWRRGEALEVRPRDAELQQINDDWVDPNRGTYRLAIGEEYTLRFTVRKPPRPTMPPRTRDYTVKLGWLYEPDKRSEEDK